jgi:hypothetical protein
VRGFRTTVLALSCCAFVSGCADTDLVVRFLRSETYTLSWTEQRLIEQVARSAIKEVRPLLATLPRKVLLTVRIGSDVIEETGETADAMPPDAIMWTVDPHRHGGVVAITRQWLRATLFHELHHLARSAAVQPRSIVDHAVYEGMATIFERDFAGVQTPWGAYPKNVNEWADELMRLPENAPRKDWLYSHPDGRRWIGIKVGAFWVDQASARSSRSAADLCTISTRDLLALAER